MEKPVPVRTPDEVADLPKAICPLTGSLIFGKRITPHSIELRTCKNGSLFAVCRLHQVRVFYADPRIIEDLTGEPYGTTQVKK